MVTVRKVTAKAVALCPHCGCESTRIPRTFVDRLLHRSASRKWECDSCYHRFFQPLQRNA